MPSTYTMTIPFVAADDKNAIIQMLMVAHLLKEMKMQVPEKFIVKDTEGNIINEENFS